MCSVVPALQLCWVSSWGPGLCKKWWGGGGNTTKSDGAKYLGGGGPKPLVTGEVTPWFSGTCKVSSCSRHLLRPGRQAVSTDGGFV